jgi:adenylyltransferase/sulfurtransferase
LDGRFRHMKVHKDPACPVCGESPTVTELIDYDQFCGIPHSDNGVAVEPVPALATA